MCFPASSPVNRPVSCIRTPHSPPKSRNPHTEFRRSLLSSPQAIWLPMCRVVMGQSDHQEVVYSNDE
jgi:hypothetical protein